MITDPFDRAAMTLGLAGVASTLYALSTSQGAGLFVVAVIGACAVLGAVRGIRLLVLAAGALYLVAALIQLAQLGRSTNWLDGGGSLFAVMLGLGVGLVTLVLARDRSEPNRIE
ncbi:MAG: hypothetical protein WKF54_07645 [Nocardioidaceae bacterium]